MKTHHIEIQRFKAMTHGNGLIEARVDALIQPSPRSDEGEPSTVLSMTEANARVLVALLRAELTELDKRKAKSRR